MMDEMKRGLKLIKYANGFKVTAVITILFCLIAIVISFVDLQFIVIASVEIFMSIIMFAQMEYSLLATGICASSPRKRNLETWLPDLSGLVLGIAGYLVILVIIMVNYFYASEEVKQICGAGILFSGMMGGITLVYGSLVYKNNIIAFIVFFSGFYSLLICFESGMSVSLTAGVWGGFAFILVGVVAAGILRRLLYRKPLNKVAFGIRFRRKM